MRVVLYNDTTLINSHFGPQLVVEAAREHLTRRNVELVGTLHRDALPQDHRTLLSQSDLVLVNGEGSIHHGNCRHLIDVADEYPAALINCVYQDNEPNKALAKFRLIAARETRSAQHLKECGADHVEVVPDLMFDSSRLRQWQRQKPSLDLGLTDNVIDWESGQPPFVPAPVDYLAWLSRHRRIVCGRYHAAVACCVLGIPFSCWPSNTWKTEGMLDDMGVPNLMFASQEEAIQSCPESFDSNVCRRIEEYIAAARVKIDQLFNQLCDPASLAN